MINNNCKVEINNARHKMCEYCGAVNGVKCNAPKRNPRRSQYQNYKSGRANKRLGIVKRGYARADGVRLPLNYDNGAPARRGVDPFAKGCDGICILCDTRACRGSACESCAVHAAGLCCKRYLTNIRNARVAERDGGVYWNVMAEYIARIKTDRRHDDVYRRKLKFEAGKADKLRNDIMLSLNNNGDGAAAEIPPGFSLGELLAVFPHADVRPDRVGTQFFIYLCRNFKNHIELEHIEERFFTHGLLINRLCKTCFGYSYTGLLTKMRIEYSKLLLMIPDLRIKEITYLTGYNATSEYSINFKRCEGVSPKQYREAARNAGRLPPAGAHDDSRLPAATTHVESQFPVEIAHADSRFSAAATHADNRLPPAGAHDDSRLPATSARDF